MLAALRYRRGQALVVIVLSALVTTCLVLAPLYTRALEQAMVRTTLHEASATQTSVRLASTSSTAPAIAMSPNALAQLIPASVQPLFGMPVGSTHIGVRRLPFDGQPGGSLLSRDGMCGFVRFTSGRCPTAAGEVAISADQAKAYGMPLRSTVVVGEFDEAVSTLESSPRTTLTVVGTYEQIPGPYWFGDRLTGQASAGQGFDVMLTPIQTLTDPVTARDGSRTSWFQPQYAADVPLLVDRVGIDEMGALGSAVADLVQHPLGAERDATDIGKTLTVTSGIPAIADEVRVGSSQAAVTVPLLMAQMVLLLVCVLWLVLVAAADQRRGEVAVARLRGRGSRGARRLLLAETLPLVVVGAPLGAVLAVLLTSLARRTVLTSDPPLEVPVAAVVALGLALVLMAGLAVLSVRRVSREPVAALVRSVPPRRTGIRLGVLEAMLVAGAAAAFVALVTGSVDGPVGQLAPTLLALAAGVVAARVAVFTLGAGGRMLLRHGRATSGAAFLAASRRSTTRWVVPVVTVALCITVVTVDAFAIGQRNWAGRAGAEVGAATVLDVGSANLAAVAGAVRVADPTGEHATPVALVTQGQDDGVSTVGVVPDAFRRIALWPGVDANTFAWQRLSAPTVPALVVRGTQVRYHVKASAFRTVPPVIRATPTSLVLGLRVVHDDGAEEVASLGPLPAAGVDADQGATLACSNGCRVTGVGILTPRATASVTGDVVLSQLQVDGRPVDLGPTQSWRDTDSGEVRMAGTVVDGTLRLDYANDGYEALFLTHASVPDVVPAFTTPAATPSAPGATLGGRYVDGSALLVGSAATVAFAPGGPTKASIVNLDNLLAQGWRSRGAARLSVYVDTVDPAYLAHVTSTLDALGIAVVTTTHADDVAAEYARTAAAWSLQLALVVGLLALLVAAVAILVLASTSWRARSRDYAALRLVGQSRWGRMAFALLETVPVIVGCAVLGAAVGLWAAPAAISMVPLFTTAPSTFPIDLRPAWGPAVLAALVGLVVLAAVGVVTSLRVAGRADLQRLKETA